MTHKLPVLLLHGWGGSYESTFISNRWDAELSAENRTIVRLDLPGHGSAAAPLDPADYAHLADEIERQLPAGPLHVIGYSLGAKIALSMASSAPQRFQRIVVIGVGDNAFAPEAAGEAVATALESGVTDATPAGIKVLVDYARHSGSNPKALAAVLRRPPNPILRPESLQLIGARTLLINGSLDHVALPDGELRKALAALTYALLPDLNHLRLPEDAQVRRTAIEFVDAGDVL